MAITDKLNTAWQTNVEKDLLFEFRALVDSGGGFYNTLTNVLAEIDRVAANSSFNSIDVELKQEGIAIRAIIQACKTALDDHLDFINWTQ